MGKVIRFGSSAAIATVVTFALFFLMQFLIESGAKGLPDEGPGRKIEMVKVEREQELQRKERVERPPEQIKPPELEMPKVNTNSATQTVFNFDLPTGRQNIAGSGISTGDGEYLPIVKVNPIYPRRAQEQGIQGSVLVRYTVTTSGATKDVIVVESEPRGYFERAAVKAAEKYKYKPRIINGVAVEVPGVQTRIYFNLADE
ncbi:MAG: TonB family protein [Sphingomonadales bacterium]